MAAKKPQVRKPKFEFVDDADPSSLVVDRLYDDAPAPAAPAATQEGPGFIRGTGDVALSLGQGAVGAVKSISDVFGADNAVSESMGGMSRFMQGLKSDESQAKLAASQQRIKAAEDSGSTSEEVKAYMGMLWDQPLEMLAQGIGSFATLGFGKAAQALKFAQAAKAAGMSKEAFLATQAGANAARIAADAGFKTNIGVGVAQGLGAVKGSQYEQTYNNAVAQGMPPEQAKALAEEAQSYGGDGTLQQLLGAGLGGLASATGPIERLVAGKAASSAPSSMLGAMGKGFAVEGATEGAQGGQERYAGNVAAINAGVLDPSKSMTGVVGQSFQEGTLGGILGAAAGPFEGGPQAEAAPPVAPPPAPIVPESGPLTRAVNAGAVSQPLLGNSKVDPLLLGNDRAGQPQLGYNEGMASVMRVGPDGAVTPETPEQLNETRIRQEEREKLGMGRTTATRPQDADVVDIPAADVREVQEPSAPEASDVAPEEGPSFDSIDEADAYVTQQFKLNSSVRALPVVEEDGTIAMVPKSDPRFPQAQKDRTARKKAKKEPARADTATPSGAGTTDRGTVSGDSGVVEQPAIEQGSSGADAAGALDGTQQRDPSGEAGRAGSSDALNPSMLAATRPQPKTTGPQPINAQPAGTRGTTAADILKPVQQPVQDQGATDAPQGAGGSQPTPAQAAPDYKEAEAEWTRMPTADRLATAKRAGWSKFANKAWSQMKDAQRASIAQAIAARYAPNAQTDQGTGTQTKTPADQAGTPAGSPGAAGATGNTVDTRAGSPEVEADGLTPKERWLKAILDANRLIGPTGPQLSVTQDGKLTYLGNPNTSKAGKSLMANVEEARKAGATDAEIAAALREKQPAQANQQDRLRDARALGKKAGESGQDRTPPTAFTSLEKQTWRTGWDEAKATKGATPQVPAEPAKREAFEHSGLKVYPTRVNIGGEPVDRWAVQSPENKGTTKVGGDSLHETVEQAKKAAELEARQAADRAETRAKIDAQEKAEADEREAKKEANRPKTVLERRADAVLDKAVSYDGKPTTRRTLIAAAVEQGLAFVEAKVFDSAAKKRDEATMDSVRRAGYILGASNENIPLVKAGLEANARLKKPGSYDTKSEYRLYQSRKAEGPFREITKIEYDYARKLEAQTKGEAAKEPVKPAKENKAQREAREAEERRATYFAPGNIIQGYSGHDRVIAYKAPTEPGGAWSVQVQHVIKKDGEWIADPNPFNGRVRNHATEPSSADYKRGPVGRFEDSAAPAAAPSQDDEKLSAQWDAMSIETRASALAAGDDALFTPTGRVSATALRLAAAQWSELMPALRQKAAPFVKLHKAKGAADTHKDPGEPAEPVTPAVVREAIKTGVDATDRKPSAMRDELLADIDQAIQDAPDYADYQAAVKEFGEKEAISRYTMESSDFRAKGEKYAPPDHSRPTRLFSVKGDGKFTIRNTVRQLLIFKKQVQSSPGFKDSKAAKPPVERVGDALDNRGPQSAILNMLEDKDYQAAKDFADFKGLTQAEWLALGKKLPKKDQIGFDAWNAGQREQASEPAKPAAQAEAAPAWHTPLPTEGGKVTNQDRTTPSNPKSVIDGRKVVSRLAQEAMDAITRNQNENIATGGIKLTPWVLPATNDRNGVVRLLPEDQSPGAPWQQIGTEPLPLGGPRERALGQLMDRLRSAPIIASDDPATAKPAAPAVSSPEGQKNLAYRGSRIAALKAMNDRLRKLAPSEAWADSNIEQSDDLDALQDQISEALVKAQKAPEAANPLRAELEEMSGAELSAVFERMGLAGKLMTHAEKVEALLAEDQDAVRAAMTPIPEGYKKAGEPFYRDGKLTQGYAKFAPGDRVRDTESRFVGVVDGPMGQGPVFDKLIVKFDNGSAMTVPGSRLEAEGEAKPTALKYPLAPAGSRYEESDKPIKMMSPDEFLAAVRPLDIDESSRDNIDDLKRHIQSGKTLDPLHIRADGKEDGRHRAVAAKELGIKQVPVVDERARPGKAVPGKLDNFGEALPPARRAMAAKLDESLADDDIATRPFSEIWPLSENEAIEDTFAAAVAHAARAEVPAKPRQAYKLKRWVDKVKGVRGLTAHVLSGRLTRERLMEEVKGPRASLKDWASKVMLLEQIPREQWKRIGEVEERPDASIYADGKPVSRPLLRLTVDDKAHYLSDGDGTVAGSLDEIRALLEPAAPEKRMEFEVRGPSGGPYKINKKGDGQYRSLGNYATVPEARDAIAEYNGLVAAWEAIKANDNITERDLRTAENRPRAGKDWRDGKDVTPEQFQAEFGFKGGEFGKWVQQGKGDKERQALLNGAYDALMDLAKIAGIPPRAISLNGTLGIAFGSRGNGWASAHFEPSNLVINLTKTRGAGALAHEWLHAVDNYFSRMRRGGEESKFTGSQSDYRTNNFITHKPEAMMVPKTATRYLPPMTRTRLEAEHARRKSQTDAYNPENWQPDPKHPQGVRPEVEQRFADLVQALNDSPMTKRAMLLDGNKTGNGYWSQTLERAARAFESYVIARMHEDGYHNDFLVNVRKAADTGKNTERYPYLLPGEIKPVADAFGALFDTIQTRTDDAGNVAMFSRSRETQAVYESRIDALFDGQKAQSGTRVLDRSDVMGLMGHADVPLMLNERHLLDGLTNHPEMTAEVWKSVPEWLENPAAVYTDPKHPGRLTVIAPARIAGYPVIMAIEPNAGNPVRGPGGTVPVEHLLVTVFAKTTGELPRLESLAGNGRLLYADTKMAPSVWQRAGEVPRAGGQSSGAKRILTEKNLAGYRRAAQPETGAFSRNRSSSGVTMRDARAAVGLIRRELPSAPEIIVLESLSQAPDRLQNDVRNAGAERDWEAAYHDGKIYVMPDHIEDMDRFMFVVGRHEVRHAGFDAILGDQKDAMLLSIGRANRRVMREAKQKMDDGLAKSEVVAIEEALADMPVEDIAALTRIKVLVAAVRRWLRSTAFKLRKAGWRALADSIEPKTWTDNDVIAFVFKAEDVSRGPGGGGGGGVRFSRATEGAKTVTNDEGHAEFIFGDTKLAFPIPTERIEVIPVKGQTVMQYAIMPTEGFDVLGHVDLLLENGKPVSLLDIEAYKRGNGVGRKTIETLLRANPGADLNISNIVPEAQGFWESMGVPVQNLEEGAAYDGTLNLETYLQAQDGEATQGNARRPGSQGGSLDARAKGRAPEKDQGRQVGALFSRSNSLGKLREAGARKAEAVRDANLFAGYKVGDFVSSTGTLSWWDKSIGTPFNLAKRHPDTFGRVFNAVQDFLTDVSFYATESANLAPKLLPKLETIKDLTKQAISPEDSKAIAAPIFEGTLNWTRDDKGRPVRIEAGDEKAKPGIVFTPDELRSIFKLTQAQAALYEEFRASVDRSLDDLTVSEITRLVRSELPGAIQGEGQSPQAFADEIRQALIDIGSDDTAGRVAKMAERLTELKANGYAPLSRFGHHTLDVVDADGERVYFGLFESQAEANKKARQMRAEFPKATVTQGTQSQEAYKMLAGVSPETIELFGEILGLDASGDKESDKAFQEYLKKAKSTRSAMKRLIHRKGIAGFSEDAGRVLAGFITSNARRTASNHRLKDVLDSVQDMPKEQGELKDYAAKMAEYVQNPIEEAQRLRGLMFVQYLGGSIASALVNMTQPIAVTMPYLSQHTSAANAAKLVTGALADMAGKKKLEGTLEEALKLAEEKGIVAPQEIHYLQAQAQGAGSLVSGDGTAAGNAAAKAQNGWSKLSVAWGKLFGFAELVNRRATFIASYRLAVQNKYPNPFQFATDAVNETQFVYNKGCVDDQTECLTLQGWKRHADLLPGELVYAVDKDGALVESRLEDVHRYTDGGYAATEFRNQNGLSMVLTPEHKCVVQNYSSRDKNWQRQRLVRADAVKGSNHFVRVPLADATNRQAVYSDDEVRLFAWVAAEGSLFAHRNCVGKRGVRLCQSAQHNPQYVAEIDALLARLGGHHTRHLARGGEMVNWVLRKALWAKVNEALPGKMVSHALVAKLTPAQMALFIETFAKGDGHFPEDGGVTVTQKDVGNLSALQAMAVLSGQSSTLYERMGRHDFGALYVSKESKRAHVKAMTQTPLELDMVWCPQTEHGTWIARRNGRTFVTGNSRPVWARGAIGATLFTFKTYSISYVELLYRMWKLGGPEGKKAFAFAIATMILMSGVDELPFMEDVEDVIDGFAQRVLGLNWQTKAKRNEWAAKILGEDLAHFLAKGVSGVPGVPLDVSGRLGMGNLLPGTGLFRKDSQDPARDVAEIAGPVGDLLKRGFTAAGMAASGEVTKAALEISPVAIRNVAKGADMADTGMYRDATGKKVIETTPTEAILKGIGFQPNTVARVQDANFSKTRMIGLNKRVESEIADLWALGRFEGDPAKVERARNRLKEWNRQNPDSPIRIQQGQIKKRVDAMRLSKAQRIAKTAPKEIRAEVKREVTQ